MRYVPPWPLQPLAFSSFISFETRRIDIWLLLLRVLWATLATWLRRKNKTAPGDITFGNSTRNERTWKLISQEGRGAEGGGAVDPARPNRWCLPPRVCADIVEFLLNFRPLRTILVLFFFFSFSLLFFPPQRTEKSLLIPSWKTNPPPPPSLLGIVASGTRARARASYLLNFSWLKGLNSIFRFFLEIFYFLSFFLSLFSFLFLSYSRRFEAFGEFLRWSFF